MSEIINRVTNSSLITIDLAHFHHPGERIIFDLKELLFQGIALKEKEFRLFLKNHDWEQYQDKNIGIICSVNAIIPTWAYMLLSVHFSQYAHFVAFANATELEVLLMQHQITQINIEDYKDKKVVIKGCGHLNIPNAAYVELVRKLQPVVSNLMFGEPCSTVPLYKQTKK